MREPMGRAAADAQAKRLEKLQADFNRGASVPYLALRVLRAKEDGRQWDDTDKQAAYQYALGCMADLDDLEIFEPGTPGNARMNDLFNQIEEAEQLLNGNDVNLYSSDKARQCLFDKKGFEFMGASGFDPYIEDKNIYGFGKEKGMEQRLKTPDMVGNGNHGFGITFEEYCRQHDDRMHMNVLKKTAEEAARDSGYANTMEYWRAGYVRSAVNGFEMAETCGKRMGIDTREPVGFMEAAMDGYRMKAEKARLMKEPVDVDSLRKMNQLVQTVNLNTLEYFGSRGNENIDYDLETRETMASCIWEANYYNGNIPEPLDDIRDRINRDPHDLSYEAQKADYQVKRACGRENGWVNLYPLDDFTFTVEHFMPKADGSPKVSNPKFDKVDYTFAENAAAAKETAKELYPQAENKTPAKGSALAKALASGDEMESKAASMESGMDFE